MCSLILPTQPTNTAVARVQLDLQASQDALAESRTVMDSIVAEMRAGIEERAQAITRLEASLQTAHDELTSTRAAHAAEVVVRCP